MYIQNERPRGPSDEYPMDLLAHFYVVLVLGWLRPYSSMDASY